MRRDENCADRERKRGRERGEKRVQHRATSRATTVPQALISSIISFGDAADRWWVRENERESISGNQPPGLRSAARRRRREQKYREMLRSNNPPRPPSFRPLLTLHSIHLSHSQREKIKNLNRRSRHTVGIQFSIGKYIWIIPPR